MARFFIIAATILGVTASVVASPEKASSHLMNPQEVVHDAINVLHRAKITHGHAFSFQQQQQQQGGGGPSPSNCSASVQDQYKQLMTDCGASLAALSIITGDQGDDTIRQQVDAVCQASCTQRAFNFVLANKCLYGSSDGQNSIRMMQWLCTVDNGKTCGARLAMVNPNCGAATTSTACGNRPQCMWGTVTGSTNGGGTASPTCYSKPPSSDTIGAICGGGCFDAYIKLSNDISPGMGASASESKKLICKKVDDQYCSVALGAVQPDLQTTQQLFDSVCTDATKVKCFTALTGSNAASLEQSATASFTACIKYAGQSSFMINSCLRSFAFSLNSARQKRLSTDMLCVKSNKTSSGQSCAIVVGNVQKSDAYASCGSAIFYNPGRCSETCNALYSTTLNNYGCCAYYIGQLTSRGLPPDSAIPAGISNATLSFSAINGSDFAPPFFFASACSWVQGNMSNYGPCKVPMDKAVNKSTVTAISMDALVRQGLVASTTESFANDVASSIGVPRTVIVNPKLTTDGTHKVKVGSARRATATENAAIFQFQIAAADDSSTTDAASTFDKQVSSGTLQTTSTSSTLSACTSCVDSSSNGLVTAGSSSTAASVVAGLVFALAASLIVVV